MFSWSPSRFGDGQPWFRIGTFDVGSAGVFCILVIVGQLIWLIEGPGRAVSTWMFFSIPDVLRGQVWRLFTWFMVNQPSLWLIIAIALIYLFGGQLENAVGRVRMAQYLLALVLAPPLAAFVPYFLGIDSTFGSQIRVAVGGANLIQDMLLISFVLFLPNVRFFFGIPGWVIAAVVWGLDLFISAGNREWGVVLLLLILIGLTMLISKAFGFADEIDWIPDVPRVGSGGNNTRSQRRKNQSNVVSIADPLETAKIDAILDQIAEHGEASLTAEQRRYLKKFRRR